MLRKTSWHSSKSSVGLTRRNRVSDLDCAELFGLIFSAAEWLGLAIARMDGYILFSFADAFQ
jgi:hypothetical protein